MADCLHSVALAGGGPIPPEVLQALPPPSPPSRSYPFPLDPFQSLATTCIDRHESVLVCAHTSAGKSVCAEHAVGLALSEGGRAVYTSPIKALSNQKFQQLSDAFGDVGLITGETQLCEEASCLVMTTEILRLMLYRGSTVTRELRWVIIDEAHLLGTERGWVIEEVLILLPRSVRLVLLSATIPNAMEVAEWISSLSSQPVHVVKTSTRPTPLLHYACPAGGDGLYLIQRGEGPFREAAWQSAVSNLRMPRMKKAGKRPERPEEEPRADNGKGAEVVRVARACAERDLLPAIVFCPSKKECELVGKAVAASCSSRGEGGEEGDDRPSPLELLSPGDVKSVLQVFDAATESLSDEDAHLPQAKAPRLPPQEIGALWGAGCRAALRSRSSLSPISFPSPKTCHLASCFSLSSALHWFLSSTLPLLATHPALSHLPLCSILTLLLRPALLSRPSSPLGPYPSLIACASTPPRAHLPPQFLTPPSPPPYFPSAPLSSSFAAERNRGAPLGHAPGDERAGGVALLRGAAQASHRDRDGGDGPQPAREDRHLLLAHQVRRADQQDDAGD